ncbi:MAG: hypothetical protein ACREPB_01055 [Arenimonas sp.]
MPNDILVENSKEELLPFKEAWLRGTLETIKHTNASTEEVIAAVREAISRSPDLPRDASGTIVVDTDTLRHAVLEALESKQPALTVAEVVRERALNFSNHALPMDEAMAITTDAMKEIRRSKTARGISASLVIMGTQLTDIIALQDERAAEEFGAFINIAAMASNEVMLEFIEDIIAEIGDILGAPAKVIRAAQLLALSECEINLHEFDRAALLERYKTLFKESVQNNPEKMEVDPNEIFRCALVSVIEELHSRPDDGIPYGEEIDDGEHYIAVATTERKVLLEKANEGVATRCVANSRKLAGSASALWFIAPEDRPNAIQVSYQDKMLAALSARNVEEMRPVPKRWKCDQDHDLPNNYTQQIKRGMNLYGYTWTLAGETLDDSVLSKLEDARDKHGDKMVDKAKEKVKDFFDEIAQDIVPSLPPLIGGALGGKAGEAVGDLAGQGLRKLMDYVLLLLQPTTYPSYQISHLVVWPAASAPLSMVALLKPTGNGGELKPTRLDKFMPLEIAVQEAPARSGMENFKLWFGTSKPSTECAQNVFFAMQQGRVFFTDDNKKRFIRTVGINGPDAVQWRDPDKGFGVVLRQNETDSTSLTKIGSYLTAIRADIRKEKNET